MRAVTIKFNGVEWVAEARVIGMTIRGFGDTHQRILLTLSRADKVATPAMLDFIHSRECGHH